MCIEEFTQDNSDNVTENKCQGTGEFRELSDLPWVNSLMHLELVFAGLKNVKNASKKKRRRSYGVSQLTEVALQKKVLVIFFVMSLHILWKRIRAEFAQYEHEKWPI